MIGFVNLRWHPAFSFAHGPSLDRLRPQRVPSAPPQHFLRRSEHASRTRAPPVCRHAGGALLDGSLLEAKLDVNVHEGRAEALRLEIERQTDGWRSARDTCSCWTGEVLGRRSQEPVSSQ